MSTYRLGTSLPRIDVDVRAGQAFELTVPVLDDAGAAVEVTDVVSARAQVRETPASADVLYEFSTDTGGATITDTGSVLLSATAEQTADWSTSWPVAGAWWDLEVTDSSDVAHQLTAPSKVRVSPRITR
jgi:hypothetical protein